MKEGRKLKKSNLHHEAEVVERKEKVSNVKHPQAAITSEKPKVELKKKKSKKVAEETSEHSQEAEKIKGGKKGKLNKTKNKRKADEISCGHVDHLIKEADDDKTPSIETLNSNVANDDGTETRNRKSKKSNKKRKMKLTSTTKEIEKMSKVEEEEDVYEISSGDEDCSTGMKKWVTDYYENRPDLDELQKRIDDFMTAHEERLEQEKQEREAKAAEGGWTVVVHHKGRKKTTDAESGTAVGSVSQAALEDKVAKKKKTEIVGHGFYRFQRRDAQRSELLALQSKFEEDKKRIQQIRAARKFKPY